MSKKKNSFKDFVPQFKGMPMPAMPPFMQNLKASGEDGESKGESKVADLKKYLDQIIDMQKSAVNTSKEQWNQLFEHLLEMEDTFTESLSENALSLPIVPLTVSPKEFMKQLKEYQIMANDYFMGQIDSFTDFSFKRKEKFRGMVGAVVAKKEEKEEAEASDEAAK